MDLGPHLNPNRGGGWVVDPASIGGVHPLPEGCDIVGKLGVSREPDLLFKLGHIPQKLLDHTPVAVSVKLVGMAPKVEKRGPKSRSLTEFSGQLHQLRIVVMAGGVPFHKIRGNLKAVGGDNGSCPHIIKCFCKSGNITKIGSTPMTAKAIHIPTLGMVI